MKENSIESSRVVTVRDTDRINEILLWFRYDYPEKLLMVDRYKYLGIPCKISRYSVELEAYKKENELRELRGEEKLPPLKITKLF